MERQNETIAPDERRFSRRSTVSSPRTWGCTGGVTGVGELAALIPTHVGVHRFFPGRSSMTSSHPHARGGAPSASCQAREPQSSSPRTWGCTDHRQRERRARRLIPTHVGVHRSSLSGALAWFPHPHARGGALQAQKPSMEMATSSPRTWGCTGADRVELERLDLIPTHVGVHRENAGSFALQELIPTHVGVHRREALPAAGSDPHPHARGGAPYMKAVRIAGKASSPRTWGCTGQLQVARLQTEIIPTHVRVHRSRCPAEHVIDCDPPVSRYARGGPMQLIDENLIQGALPLGVLVMTEQSSPPAYRTRFPMHGTTLRKSPRDARRQRNRSCFGCSHDAYKAPLLPPVDDFQQLHPALVVPSQPAHRDDHDDAIVPSPSMVGTPLRRDATGFVLRAPTAWRMASFPLSTSTDPQAVSAMPESCKNCYTFCLPQPVPYSGVHP